MFQEEDYLMLSGIQHFSFCRRQWALIHIEQQWAESYRTLEGNYLHEKVDSGKDETQNGVIIIRDMPIHSSTLGTSGKCDVVEFHENKNGINIVGREGLYSPVPVEYKRGRPKENDIDELQLCAQAMCLEEMMVCDIPFGYLYYNEPKRRTKVEFESNLREHVTDMFTEMHSYYKRRHTPKVKRTKSCNACSIKDICMPKLCSSESARNYFEKSIYGGEQ